MSLTNITRNGAHLILHYSDGSKKRGIAAPGGLWRVAGGSDPNPPDPEPGESPFKWPYPLAWVTAEHNDDGGYSGHQGIDFGMGAANVQGTLIPAIAKGEVVANAFDPGWGWFVKMYHGTHLGEEIWSLYAHMWRQSGVTIGQQIAQGGKVGEIGSTGNSTGNHLHLETYLGGSIYGVHTISPRTFMATYNPEGLVV